MNVTIELQVKNDPWNMCHEDIHKRFLYDSIDGVMSRPSKPWNFCPYGIPSRAQSQKLCVYPADKEHYSVLHIVSTRALACNFLYISFGMNDIENV